MVQNVLYLFVQANLYTYKWEHLLFAFLFTPEVSFVDQYTIVNGPKNSYSRQLVEWRNNNNVLESTTAASWKYQDECTHLHVTQVGVDVALVLLFIPMTELLMTQKQMRKAGKAMAWGSLLAL